MSRYIDADLAIKAIENDCPEVVYYTKRDAIDCIQATPTADAVEVVRCKDCKWWEARTFGSTIGRCENPRNGLCNEYSDDTDYCSYGERREK